MASELPPVVDADQLRRIESTHRGFLYQHLFAAGCLLMSPGSGITHVLVERDEDIELQLPGRHAYVQVKTRLGTLQPSDIAETLARFGVIRMKHKADRASADCEFWIVSNTRPSPALQQQLAEKDWPPEVRLLTPGSTKRPEYLPPAWPCIDDAVRWCASLANTLPHASLRGETLTWKLAARVQLACTGAVPYPDHRFATAELPQLFEQFAVQLHRFPDPPAPYRVALGEPELDKGTGKRLIVGFSGAGKTAWAAQIAAHTRGPIAFIDLAGLPDEAIATVLSRELAAQLLATGDARNEILAPGMSGMDACRAVSRALERSAPQAVIILDNAHAVSAVPLATAMRSLPQVTSILLARPGPVSRELEALLDMAAESLPGWPLPLIAAVFHDEGSVIDPETAERIRVLAGGLPLFVQQAARLARGQFGGDVQEMCRVLEARVHTEETRQERILQQSWNGLPALVRDAGALLALSEVPLTDIEAQRVLTQGLSVDATAAASSLRALTRSGILQPSGEVLSMHDAFRLVALGDLDRLASGAVTTARQMLLDIMELSMAARWDFGRLVFFLRLLATCGRTERLVEIATTHEEMFAEHGITHVAEPILAEIAASSRYPAKDRFWALDTLVFWSYHNGPMAVFEQKVDQLEELYVLAGKGEKEHGALLLKKMLLAGHRGQVDEARRCFDAAAVVYRNNPLLLRIFRYDFAVALFKGGLFAEAESTVVELIRQYYQVLGLKPEDVNFKNPPEILKRLADNDETFDNLKRLADTLEVCALCRVRLGKPVGLARLHAQKFFVMCNAYTSAVRVGQDVADELLAIGDLHGARSMLEKNVLPIVQHVKLLGHLVAVRAQ